MGEEPESYNPIPDADGFICWMHVGTGFEPNIHRIPACAALLSAAKVDFKIITKDSEWTQIYVRKCDTRSLEILWNLAKLVEVQAPPVLRIVVPPELPPEIETEPQEIKPEPNRFDEI